MSKFWRLIRRIPGVFAFLFLLVIRLLFTVFPEVFEALYFGPFFPFIRQVQTQFYPVLVIPGYAILILFVFGFAIFFFIRRESYRGFLVEVLNLFFWIGSAFLLFFGMQYADKGIAERLELKGAPESVDLSHLYYQTMGDALSKRMQIIGIEDAPNITSFNYPLNCDSLQEYVKQVLDPVGYQAATVDPLVQEIPGAILRKLGISGIYNPFTGESNVDKSLPTILKVFVVAHELAHASGVTGEGEANFVAWLSLSTSKDPYLEYAAAYYLWRQVAKPLNEKLSKNDLEKLVQSIPDELLADRRAIIEILLQEKAWYPELSNRINDSYLKIQGVESGVEDYDQFLEIYLRWKISANP